MIEGVGSKTMITDVVTVVIAMILLIISDEMNACAVDRRHPERGIHLSIAARPVGDVPDPEKSDRNQSGIN